MAERVKLLKNRLVCIVLGILISSFLMAELGKETVERLLK